MRKALLLSAAFSLASLPTSAQGWYPGFTGTGQVAPGGGASGGGSGSYVGPADVASANGMTPVAYWGSRAASNAAAAAGVKVYRVAGDGATGDSATTVVNDITANADGTLNYTAAYAAGGACAGGDGTCYIIGKYDQIGQVNGTTPYNAGSVTTYTGTNNPSNYAEKFYSKCPVGNTLLPCGYNPTGSNYKTLLTTQQQPLVYSVVLYRVQNSTPAYTTTVFMGPAGGAAPSVGATTTAGTVNVNGVNSAGAFTEGKLNAFNNLFNGTSSGLLVNGSTSFLLPSQATTALTTNLYLNSTNGTSPVLGAMNEQAVYSGTPSAAQLNLVAKNQSAYWSNLGF